jgi:hypothetical protein
MFAFVPIKQHYFLKRPERGAFIADELFVLWLDDRAFLVATGGRRRLTDQARPRQNASDLVEGVQSNFDLHALGLRHGARGAPIANKAHPLPERQRPKDHGEHP